MLKVVAVGVCVLLGILAGCAGLCMTDRYREQVNTPDAEPGGPALPESRKPERIAAAFFSRFKSMTAREWALILTAAALLGAAAVRFADGQEELILDVRMLAAALLLLPAMVVDWYTHRIPNLLVLVMLAAGTAFLAADYFFRPEQFKGQVVSSILGLAGFLVLFYLMARVTRGGIGMGDVKLIAAEGWLVGFGAALAALMVGLLACSVTAAVLLISKKKGAKDQVPFGPFLYFGFVLSLLIFGI